MHELSVTESILEIATRHAQAQKARNITDLYLVIGQWSSVVDDSIQFYWDIISFRRVMTELICQDCGQEYQPSSESMICPRCASTNVKVKVGEEFFLEAIDVEE